MSETKSLLERLEAKRNKLILKILKIDERIKRLKGEKENVDSL